MQDAYVVDQQKVGTFADIGYEKPTSSVFTYTEGAKKTADWTASAGGKLDKCTGTGGDTWTVGVEVADGASAATYSASDNCPALTPNFKWIGSSK